MKGGGEGERGRWSKKGTDNFPNAFLVVDKNLKEKAIQEHGRKTITYNCQINIFLRNPARSAEHHTVHAKLFARNQIADIISIFLFTLIQLKFPFQ